MSHEAVTTTRAVIPENECREAIGAFMRDWNAFPAAQCARLMAKRLRGLLEKYGDREPSAPNPP